MRIGIDARFLTHPQPGGFKTYTVNLLAALGQIDRDDQFFIYLDRRPTDNAVLPAAPNFTYRIVSGTMPIIGMPWREQIGLRRQIARDKLDLVHFLCNTATYGLPDRYVVTLHDTIQLSMKVTPGSSLAGLKRWAIAYYSKQSILWAVSRADHIITDTEYARDAIFRSLHVPLDRITVVYPAPNPIFEPVTLAQKAVWLPDLEKRLGVRGRFLLGVGYEERKNIPLLIKAFGKLAADFPALSLVIVAAEKHQQAAFQQLADDLDLSTQVVVIGRLALPDLVRLYQSAELFVFPSEREGYGLPPLEAMACGLPTIAMAASCIPEVVQDGALLVDGKDVDMWANAIRTMIASDERRAELRAQGLYRVAYFNWSRCAEGMLAIYRSVR